MTDIKMKIKKFQISGKNHKSYNPFNLKNSLYFLPAEKFRSENERLQQRSDSPNDSDEEADLQEMSKISGFKLNSYLITKSF